MTHFKTFPLTAVVGQDAMKLALVLNAINPKIGGVLIKGTKGTAKSTAVRALADLLPEQRVIKNCPFNCNPDNPKEACHSCQHRIEANEIGPDDVELKKMRVINLPINATEDRVVGTIDIKQALAHGLKALEPGILAEANRNILYIDEVNLLADNVADVLLDSAAMGINIIEREGISLHHPASFILIGTMNPEEGNIRPQLLDRFGLGVDAETITDVDQRVLIVKRAEAYHADPAAFHYQFETQQRELASKIITARARLPSVRISDMLLKDIARICVGLGADGHRADITINITAKAIAAFEGRDEVLIDDVRTAAKLALNHRMHRRPFEEKTLDESKIDDILAGEHHQKGDAPPEMNDANDQDERSNLDARPPVPDTRIMNTREETFDIGARVDASRLVGERKVRESLNASGKVVLHPTSDARGKYVSAAKHHGLNIPVSSDVAVVPTINNASLDKENRTEIRGENQIVIKDEHIHVKRRMGKSSFLVIFCVDASGSMGVQARMEAAKGVILSMLHESYIRRDKVSLVVFRQETAEVVLPPTRSVDLALKSLKEIPTGGTTPLLAGLGKALEIANEERVRQTGYIPLIILISDARGNVYHEDPIEDLLKMGEEIARQSVETILIDTEVVDVNIGLARRLAVAAGASYHRLDRMSVDALQDVLRAEGIAGDEGA